MANIWALIQLLLKLWKGFELLMGWIDQMKYDSAIREINEKIAIAGDPDKPLEERLKAGKDLENEQNSHSR